MLGAGALGSIVADVLVRMGLVRLTIVDHDLFEAGNLVRHRLTLPHLHASKAHALAHELNAATPLARVEGLLATAQGDDVRHALGAADVVLDLTADDDVLRALPLSGTRAEALIVSASAGLHGAQLYAYADQAGRFSADDFDAWFAPFRRHEHALADAADLPHGVGCWNPLVPVPLHRLLVLAGLLAEHLQAWATVLPSSAAPRVVPYPADVLALRASP